MKLISLLSLCILLFLSVKSQRKSSHNNQGNTKTTLKGNNNVIVNGDNNSVVIKIETHKFDLNKDFKSLEAYIKKDKEFAEAFKPFLDNPQLLKNLIINDKETPEHIYTREEFGKILYKYISEIKTLKDKLELYANNNNDSTIFQKTIEANQQLEKLDNNGYQNTLDEIINIKNNRIKKENIEMAELFDLKASNYFYQNDYPNALDNIKSAIKLDDQYEEYKYLEGVILLNNYQLKESLEIFTHLIENSTDSTLIFDCTRKIAACLADQQNINSLENFRRVLKACERRFGKEDIITAIVCVDFAGTCAVFGEGLMGLQLLDRARPIFENYYTTSDNLATLYNNYGLILKGLQQFTPAIFFYKKAIRMYESLYGVENLTTVIAYVNIGVAFGEVHSFDSSFHYIKKGLAFQIKKFGEDFPLVGSTFGNLARVYYLTKNYDEAIKYFEKEHVINQKRFGENKLTASYYNNLGLIWHDKDNYNKAFFNYSKALVLIERFLGKENIGVASISNSLGELCESHKQPKKALVYYEKALPIFRNKYGEADGMTQMVNSKIENIKRKIRH